MAKLGCFHWKIMAAHRAGLLRGASVLTMVLSLAGVAGAQDAAGVKPVSGTAQPSGVVELDRVVAIVNGDLVLESDIDEERRFVVFQPYSEPTGSFSRAQAIQRLIDRTLILQQAKEQPRKPITDKDVQANLTDLRKDILVCKQYKCDTTEGWTRFLRDNGFTEEELQRHWRDRMETLQFIEDRFRMGIRISDQDAKDYYAKELVPKYAERKVTPPKFDAISDRIREILLQEQVGKLLDDWLKALRASGDVRMVTVDEVTQ